MTEKLCALALVTLLAGCDGGGPLRPDGGPMIEQATYYEHVRPILVENCVMCHHEGGIGPFPMTTFAEAVEIGSEMEEMTRLKIMPPFLADNSGECQQWSNYRGLTDEEIATIGNWYFGGMPEGDPGTPAPEEVTLPSLASVDLTLEMPMEYSINTAIDDEYRCFVVEVPTTENVFVSGYDVTPGNTDRVHHVIVFNPQDATAAQRARDRDAQDGTVGDGYTCFGDSGVNALPMVLWAPGAGATMFPRDHGDQSGIEIVAGRPLIIQMHYNNLDQEDAPRTDRTSIALSTIPDDCHARPAYWFPVADFEFELPPRESMVETSDTWSLEEVGIPSFALLPVWGVAPHMHTLGRSLTVTRIEANGDEECLVDIPRWDFHWQMAYFLNNPVMVRGTDSVRITCRYDTMDRDAPVTWGEGTEDEMCISFMYVIDPTGNGACD
jgi:hypothetical protein